MKSHGLLATCLALFIVWQLPATSALAQQQPRYDAMQELLDGEAREAMGKGDYKRALHFFWRLLKIDPNDASALREAGRCAKALGYTMYAERALARTNELHGGMLDPELHFLRGEALLSLGRKQEAWEELAQAETELRSLMLDRNAKLWLARIYALRGDLTHSDKAYWDLLPTNSGSKEYADLMADMAEAHILAKDWTGAEWVLRRLIRAQPGCVRGREMLAWVLERRGDTDGELTLRAHLASEDGVDDPSGRQVRYGQALERSHDYAGALDRYRQAEELGNKDMGTAIERVELVISPETAAGMTMSDDPSGATRSWLAGATVPFGSHVRVAVAGARTEVLERNFTLTTVTPRLVLDRRGDVLALGGTLYWDDMQANVQAGGNLALRTRPGRPLQLQLTSELAMPWRESVSTIVQGGAVDSLQLDAYSTPFSDKVVFGVTGRARRLGLSPMPEEPNLSAQQLFGAGGVDLVLWADPDHVVPGEILDDEMLWPVGMASSAVLSYRHYELFSDDPFGQRLVLVTRSQIDETSGAYRQTLGKGGAVAFEVRGGIGYDWARNVQQWRGGASLLLSPTMNTRFTLAYDASSESGTGLAGRRHTGWIMLHVDL